MTAPTPTEAPPTTPREAKAQGRAAKAYAKATRPFYKKKRYWLLAVIVVIVVAIAMSASGTSKPSTNGVASNSTNGSHPPQADVTVSSCKYDAATSFATAKLTVLNHSSKRSNYFITVSFENSKGVLLGSNGAAGGLNVEPGQTALVDAVDTLSAVPDKVICNVTGVDRLAA
jgi:hypothetical protein